MKLTLIELGIFRRIIIEHLQFAHAIISGIPGAWVANRQPIVPLGWNQTFKAHFKISVLLVGVNDTAFSFEGPEEISFHSIMVNGPLPYVIGISMDPAFRCENLIGLLAANFAN